MIPESLIKNPIEISGKPIAGQILASNVDLPQALVGLSKYYPIRMWFSEPVTLFSKHIWRKGPEPNQKYYQPYKTGSDLTISKFFISGGQLCYCTTRNSRRGYYFEVLDKVVKYDIVLQRNKKEFSGYESFKARFDPLFITETEIQKLWNGQSSQHGGKYTPKDFHGMGPRGKQIMTDFLRRFKGIKDTPRETYNEEGYLHARYQSYHHTGRDISISHLYGKDFVWYSSEFPNCGNGRYGLVANKNTFLWLEDD